jgi:hypothetical protein
MKTKTSGIFTVAATIALVLVLFKTTQSPWLGFAAAVIVLICLELKSRTDQQKVCTDYGITTCGFTYVGLLLVRYYDYFEPPQLTFALGVGMLGACLISSVRRFVFGSHQRPFFTL